MFLRTALLLGVASLAHAARLTVSIASSAGLPNPATLSSTTHAVLLGPAGTSYDVPIRRNSDFVFPDLEPASYLLTVHSKDYFFPPLRVDVTTGNGSEGTAGETGEKIEAWQTFRGNEWSNKGPSYGSGKDSLTVQISASGQKDFYQERGGFNILSFLKSPMILMGLVSVVFIFGLPYIMDNMDPETKAEFDEMRAKGPIAGSDGAASQLQNFDLAGWMAGKGQGGGGNGGGSKKK